MRISDWSSDVCSSDLLGETTNLSADEAATSLAQLMNIMQTAPEDVDRLGSAVVALGNNGASTERDIVEMSQRIARSEERRVGKACVSTCRSRWSPYHEKKTNKNK